MAWGRKKGRAADAARAGQGRRPAAWLAAAAVLAAAALLLLRAPSPGRAVSPKPPPSPRTLPRSSANAASAPGRAASPKPPSRPAATNAAPPAPAPAARAWRGVAVVSSSCATNRDGAVVERLVLADGRSVRLSRLPAPAFRRPCDQLLAAALSAPPGAGLPPLPLGPGAEASFRATMDEPPEEARPGDPPELRALKARVAEARARIAASVRAGGSFLAALGEYEDWAAGEAAARLEAARAASARPEGGAE